MWLLQASYRFAAMGLNYVLPVGQHHLDALRIQIADAIQGSSHNRNSAMAVLMTPHLQDPTVIVLWVVVSNIFYFQPYLGK